MQTTHTRRNPVMRFSRKSTVGMGTGATLCMCKESKAGLKTGN
jgi:hypothetical protein